MVTRKLNSEQILIHLPNGWVKVI